MGREMGRTSEKRRSEILVLTNRRFDGYVGCETRSGAYQGDRLSNGEFPVVLMLTSPA